VNPSTPVRPTRLEIAGAQLAALQAGDPDGPRVVLLPGFPGSKEDFTLILAPLAEAGFFVTALDLPGQFESPGPADPSAYTPDALATVALAVIDHLGAPAHLVGHSYGGLVARSAVIADGMADGDRRIASLVLMSSGPDAIGGMRKMLLDHLDPVLAMGDLGALHDATVALVAMAPGYVAPTATEAEFQRRRFVANSPAMLRGIGDAIRREPDRVAELAAIGRPTLVLYGVGDDAWIPSVQDDMAERLGAKRSVIAAATHSPAQENPNDTVNALTEFWASLSQ
jgi:pimeloyl-ACP methyl ester carboxylesterase